MEVFRRLGEELDDRWRDHDYDERVFPKLASQALERSDELDDIVPLDLLQWMARASRLPPQADAGSNFGDLALTLFETPRFFVSCLFWVDGSTAIHQHSFSGAFRVLAGGSIHTRFGFREERSFNSRFRVGELEIQKVDLLTPGSVRPIESGEAFIHSLYHLERPSLTLVVRTGTDPGSEPQWSYDPSGIATDTFYRERVGIKKLEAARLLLMLEPARAEEELGRMLEGADVLLTYQLLTTIRWQLHADVLAQQFDSRSPEERFGTLLEIARRRHGDVVDRIERGFEERDRQEWIVALRAQLTRPEERYLLALLLNFPGKEPVLELLRKRYPDRDPVEEFVDRVHELATTRVMGSQEANLLAIPAFDVEHRIVLRRLLEGGSVDDAAADLATELADPPDEAARVAAQVDAELRGTMLLRALFANK